ncbi:hypothetical protein BBG47_07070 [Paenibacillus sp. KS1]|uniref:alpha/beta fold hydrolase n=1 Tax=Paenibacillus sp. KS1 TaxID=1849249 RepID=UPI0008066C56|nr:hypothetical protein BBG47_07070 [Paenibacillus sp. KS1]
MEQVTLVGHSIGGELATNFTLSSPDRVAQLIAVAPSLTGFIFSDAHPILYACLHKVAQL